MDQLQGGETARTTSKLSAKRMTPIIWIFKSSTTLYRYDMERKSSDRELKFTAAQMMSILFFTEIKKIGVEDYNQMITGEVPRSY